MNLKNIKKICRQICILSTFGLIFMSCSKWTEVEPIEIRKNDFSKDNPGEYQKYLEDLRNYKSSDHHIVFGWYDNSVKVAFNQSHHINQTPDSLDYLVLKYPDNLSSDELEQINSVKKDKGTKFLYELDFDKTIDTYNQLTIKEKDSIDLISYVQQELDKLTGLSTKYPYDGVVFSYSPRDTIHMSNAQKLLENQVQTLFHTTLSTWQQANSGKELIYKGNPQVMIEKVFLKNVKYIILPTYNELSKEGLYLSLVNAAVKDVPQDRFIVMANSISYKEEDKSKKVGYFIDETVAIMSSSNWILSRNNMGIEVKGLAIENLQYDYFNIIKSYQYSRDAINMLNPTIKKK